jgi:hypothetical protein
MARYAVTRYFVARGAVAAALLLAAACGPSVSSSKAPTLVPGTGTYAWGGALAVDEAGQGYTIVNQRLRLRILAAIDSGLAGKGYRKVDSSGAQFLARYAVGVKTTSSDVPVVDAGPDAPVPMTRCNAGGCWNGWDYGYSSPSDPAFAGMTEREAGVVLELVDRTTGAVAWHGAYRDGATGKTPSPERIKKAVGQLIKTLPPVQ